MSKVPQVGMGKGGVRTGTLAPPPHSKTPGFFTPVQWEWEPSVWAEEVGNKDLVRAEPHPGGLSVY